MRRLFHAILRLYITDDTHAIRLPAITPFTHADAIAYYAT